MDWTLLMPGVGLAVGVVVIVLIARWDRPTRNPKGRKGMDQFQHERPW